MTVPESAESIIATAAGGYAMLCRGSGLIEEAEQIEAALAFVDARERFPMGSEVLDALTGETGRIVSWDLGERRAWVRFGGESALLVEPRDLRPAPVCSCVASERDADGNRDPVPTGECEVHG
jgi:hypothetical protein